MVDATRNSISCILFSRKHTEQVKCLITRVSFLYSCDTGSREVLFYRVRHWYLRIYLSLVTTKHVCLYNNNCHDLLWILFSLSKSFHCIAPGMVSTMFKIQWESVYRGSNVHKGKWKKCREKRFSIVRQLWQMTEPTIIWHAACISGWNVQDGGVQKVSCLTR